MALVEAWKVDQIDALLTYRRLHGNLEIPIGFFVPSTAEWPSAMHDVQPTRVLPVLRKHVYEPPEDYADGCLADEHPVHPPLSFDVPAEPPWPQDLWGVDLLQLSDKRDAWLAEMAIQYSASLALLQVPSIEPPAVTFNKVYPVQLVLQCIEVMRR
ncbi:hypothetical protein SDRG_15961 [Saprolegnia diclina VS20]|uniref:Uncharacterized protein n=1 Tax=Saprolegnia diclina (strain VS20) TaxID=1156394 RepID=T0PYR7_SAPDV|nr:hypothetical protein SDRG_15961 [Saprolegnia diclina VS20]EQC26225.1 hypothetical protein SDRG_15961 [Saprolegnia diclina VS20]|eukprot:XP_008620370.1 hypothetical protein SDRG_15961 [Saprolegnia diclina VS20]